MDKLESPEKRKAPPGRTASAGWYGGVNAGFLTSGGKDHEKGL